MSVPQQRTLHRYHSIGPALEASLPLEGCLRNRRLLATGMAFWPLVLLGAVGPLAESPAPQANRANAAV